MKRRQLLERGAIAAAAYYYYPGWWEPGLTIEVQVNKFKKIYDRWSQFRTAIFEWNEINELSYESFVNK